MQALETAVAQEDYAKAAQLKKELEQLTARDPRLALQQLLQQAVAEERYQVRITCSHDLCHGQTRSCLRCCNAVAGHGGTHAYIMSSTLHRWRPQGPQTMRGIVTNVMMASGRATEALSGNGGA